MSNVQVSSSASRPQSVVSAWCWGLETQLLDVRTVLARRIEFFLSDVDGKAEMTELGMEVAVSRRAVMPEESRRNVVGPCGCPPPRTLTQASARLSSALHCIDDPLTLVSWEQLFSLSLHLWS